MLYGNASEAAVIGWVVGMSVLSTVVVVGRLYARLFIARTAGCDDALIVGSVLFAWATAACMIAQAKTGLGDHLWTLTPHEAMLNLRAYWLMIIVYNISLFCTKFSILFQYLRIFPLRLVRVATYSLMAFIGAYAIWRIVSAIFTCNPPASFWDHSIKHRKCQDRLALSLASTSLNMITDIMITVLPLPFLHKLQLPQRQKWALLGVFAIGGLVVIISILRVPSLYILMSSKDITYDNPMASIWSSVEMNVGIVCSCLPTLRRLFPILFPTAKKYSNFPTTRSDGASTGKPQDKNSESWQSFSEGSNSKSRCYTHVSSPSATYKSHKQKRSWTGRQDMLLDSTDNFELDSRIHPRNSQDQHVGGGQIFVQTDIEQQSIMRLGDESPVLGANDPAANSARFF